jgi:hypothetical protein
MTIALTNEERFLVSCRAEGELGVRQKLHTGRYSERKATWATTWLDSVDGSKSDATRAEEKRVRLLTAAAPNRKPGASLLARGLLMLTALCVVALLTFR